MRDGEVLVSKYRKFLWLSSGERRTLVQAIILLPLTSLLLRLMGLRRCQRLFSYFFRQRRRRETKRLETSLTQAQDVSRMVGMAVRHGIYPANCLQRSLTLWWLLHHQKIQSELRFGARKEDGRFEAHAWIEIAGVVLNDSEDVREHYAPFDRAITLDPAERL
jgi:hypothetical protein